MLYYLIPILFVTLGFMLEVVGLYLIIHSFTVQMGKAKCSACQYDLRGHPPDARHCPECGSDLTRSGINREDRTNLYGRRLIGFVLVFLGPAIAILLFMLIFF